MRWMILFYTSTQPCNIHSVFFSATYLNSLSFQIDSRHPSTSSWASTSPREVLRSWWRRQRIHPGVANLGSVMERASWMQQDMETQEIGNTEKHSKILQVQHATELNRGKQLVLGRIKWKIGCEGFEALLSLSTGSLDFTNVTPTKSWKEKWLCSWANIETNVKSWWLWCLSWPSLFPRARTHTHKILIFMIRTCKNRCSILWQVLW